MPDPLGTQLNKLDTLETNLSQYIAKPSGTEGIPDSFKSGTATQTPTLTTVGDLLKITYSITPEIGKVGTEIVSTLNTAAKALQDVGDKLKDLNTPAGVNPSDIIQMLQASLATAQALIPGGSPALASGSQFFNQVADLLNAVGNDVNKARTILYKLAQEFNAIAAALKP
jgi:hypothetical protein